MLFFCLIVVLCYKPSCCFQLRMTLIGFSKYCMWNVQGVYHWYPLVTFYNHAVIWICGVLSLMVWQHWQTELEWFSFAEVWFSDCFMLLFGLGYHMKAVDCFGGSVHAGPSVIRSLMLWSIPQSPLPLVPPLLILSSSFTVHCKASGLFKVLNGTRKKG